MCGTYDILKEIFLEIFYMFFIIYVNVFLYFLECIFSRCYLYYEYFINVYEIRKYRDGEREDRKLVVLLRLRFLEEILVGIVLVVLVIKGNKFYFCN